MLLMDVSFFQLISSMISSHASHLEAFETQRNKVIIVSYLLGFELSIK